MNLMVKRNVSVIVSFSGHVCVYASMGMWVGSSMAEALEFFPAFATVSRSVIPVDCPIDSSLCFYFLFQEKRFKKKIQKSVWI